MAARAKLLEILDAIEMQFDETQAYLDRQTGKVVTIDSDTLREAEDAEEDDEGAEDVPTWQVDEARQAKEFLAAEGTGRFITLPGKFEANEWEMMRGFADGLEDQRQSESLERAIHGRGAFRYFKDRIDELGLVKQWRTFRDEAYRRVALEWYENHGIEVETQA